MTGSSKEILDRPAPRPDVRIAYGQETPQFGDLRLPDGAGPHRVVVIIHGGFWKSEYSLDHIGHLADAIRRAGFATWSLEYRRVGDDGGGWPGTFHDIGAGTDYVRKLAETHPVDAGRVVALGHSAGGQMALWLATRSRGKADAAHSDTDPIALGGVVSLAGVTDLDLAWELGLGGAAVAGLLGGSPRDIPDRYHTASPIDRLPASIPQILLHGTQDREVPFRFSRQYVSKAHSHNGEVRLVRLEGRGHYELIDPRSSAWPAVEEAVRSLF